MTNFSLRSNAAELINFGSRNDLRDVVANAAGFRAVMVTCSELGYRPDSNSIFSLNELLVVQNFGNVVLPDETGTYQTEITKLLVDHSLCDVIVCGHSQCEPIAKFLDPGEREIEWLRHGDQLRDLISGFYKQDVDLNDPRLLLAATKENILLQARRVYEDALRHSVGVRLHAWLWKSDNQIAVFNQQANDFR